MRFLTQLMDAVMAATALKASQFSTGFAQNQAVFELVPAEERSKQAYVRPLRTIYYHRKCGRQTRLLIAAAETFAIAPTKNAMTVCHHCRKFFPVGEFEWAGTKLPVGS